VPSLPVGPFLAVLFDFDGTLTHPDALDFPALRSAIGCAPGTLILEYIDSLPTEEERIARRNILADFEMAAARASVPNDGAEEMIRMLTSRGIGIGIITRNTRSSIMESLKNFRSVSEKDFRVIVTRETEGRPKPHPDMLVVGDFVFDIAAGKAAGAPTVLITNGRTAPQARIPGTLPGTASTEPAADFTIRSLGELAGILGL
jgi:hydrogenase expression/formation protein HypE